MAAKSKRKLLVVEDDFFLIKVFQAKLEESGYEVRVATDGKLALETLETYTPDMILLDLVMPRMDGFEVLAELKRNKQWKNIPVIVLTNLGQESDIERVEKLGVKDYLVKADIPIHDVVNKVEQAFKRKK